MSLPALRTSKSGAPGQRGQHSTSSRRPSQLSWQAHWPHPASQLSFLTILLQEPFTPSPARSSVSILKHVFALLLCSSARHAHPAWQVLACLSTYQSQVVLQGPQAPSNLRPHFLSLILHSRPSRHLMSQVIHSSMSVLPTPGGHFHFSNVYLSVHPPTHPSFSTKRSATATCDGEQECSVTSGVSVCPVVCCVAALKIMPGAYEARRIFVLYT